MNTVEDGKTVEVHYVGTFEDGTEFDSSRSRGETIKFEVGAGRMIEGFERSVMGMSVGEVKDVVLNPQDAYGEHKQEFIQAYSKNQFPPEVDLEAGSTIAGQNELGQTMMAKIVSVNGDDVLLDFNHPMAGKTLCFNIEVVSIA